MNYKGVERGDPFVMGLCHMLLMCHFLLRCSYLREKAMWYSNGLEARMTRHSFIIIPLCHLVHSTWIVGIQIAISFLRFPCFLCKFFFLLGCLLVATMGGGRKIIEPKSFDTVRANKKV